VGHDNRRVNRQFLAEVIAHLRGAGHPAAHMDPDVYTLELTAPDADTSPEWALRCRSGREMLLAATSERVQADARSLGRPYAASIQRRWGAPIEQSFVTMTLKTFTDAVLNRPPIAATGTAASARETPDA
jgi:hypothetical protein